MFGRACSFPSWAHLPVSSSLSFAPSLLSLSSSPPLLFLLVFSVSHPSPSFLFFLDSLLLPTILLDQHLPIYLFFSSSSGALQSTSLERERDNALLIFDWKSPTFSRCCFCTAFLLLLSKSTILLQLMSLFFPKSTFCHLFSSLCSLLS